MYGSVGSLLEMPAEGARQIGRFLVEEFSASRNKRADRLQEEPPKTEKRGRFTVTETSVVKRNLGGGGSPNLLERKHGPEGRACFVRTPCGRNPEEELVYLQAGRFLICEVDPAEEPRRETETEFRVVGRFEVKEVQ